MAKKQESPDNSRRKTPKQRWAELINEVTAALKAPPAPARTEQARDEIHQFLLRNTSPENWDTYLKWAKQHPDVQEVYGIDPQNAAFDTAFVSG